MRFIENQPALFIEDEKILVITDLHIGIEYELYKSGINIPTQIAKMKNQIEKLINKTKSKTLVIIGDIKHEVPGISKQELREIPKFLSELSKKVKVEICLGNHDTFLRDISPEDVIVHDSEGFKIGKYGFNHGHAWPAKELITCDYLIISHIHPAVQFIDELGYRIVVPVWVKGKINIEKIKNKYNSEKTGKLEIIIIPPFNKLLGGKPINKKQKNDELMGPLLRNNFVYLDECELYLLDGTYLGKLRELR